MNQPWPFHIRPREVRPAVGFVIQQVDNFNAQALEDFATSGICGSLVAPLAIVSFTQISIPARPVAEGLALYTGVTSSTQVDLRPKSIMCQQVQPPATNHWIRDAPHVYYYLVEPDSTPGSLDSVLFFIQGGTPYIPLEPVVITFP